MFCSPCGCPPRGIVGAFRRGGHLKRSSSCILGEF
jgi:hypothetical protein